MNHLAQLIDCEYAFAYARKHQLHFDLFLIERAYGRAEVARKQVERFAQLRNFGSCGYGYAFAVIAARHAQRRARHCGDRLDRALGQQQRKYYREHGRDRNRNQHDKGYIARYIAYLRKRLTQQHRAVNAAARYYRRARKRPRAIHKVELPHVGHGIARQYARHQFVIYGAEYLRAVGQRLRRFGGCVRLIR